MKFLMQSARVSAVVALPLLAQGLMAPSVQAQAPFGAPNPNSPFGRPSANSPFGRPAPGGITPSTTPTVPATGKVVPSVPTTYLWDSGGQVAISRVGTWGNGVGQITRDLTYNGDDVLEMTTRNFNEGVSFEFSPPVNLDDYKTEGYVRLRLRFQEAAPPTAGFPGFTPGGSGGSSSEFGSPSTSTFQQMTPRPGGSGRQGSGGFGSGGFGSGSGRPGGFGGAPPSGGFGSAPPGGFGGPTPTFGEGTPGVPGIGMPMGPLPQETKIHRMMLTFVLEKGIASGTIDLPTDLSKVDPDDAGWRLFLLPVKELKFTPGATGQAQRMIVTSDAQDTFFMAQSALVVETGQMSVNIRRPTDPLATQLGELTIKPGLITLVADVEAGTADPMIEWNFDADNKNPDIAMRRAPLGGPAGPGATFGDGGFDKEGRPQGGFGTGGPGGGFGGAPPAGGFGGAPPAGGFGGAPPAGGFGSSPGQFGAPGGLFGAGEGAAALPVGPPVDARGLVAKFDYPNEEMDYRVEVTVTDRAGKKAPVKASILIKVRA